MDIIPVVDVKGGQAVAAVRGDRAHYRPIVTPLAASADPIAVALGLRALYPFRTLYIADLDGIEGRGADFAMQARLAAAWPGAELWIDDGRSGGLPLPDGERSRAPRAGEGENADSLIKSQLLDPMIKSHVLGSESVSSLASYQTAREHAGAAAPLSLDFRGDAFLGPPELLEEVSLWPERIIVMTLARVGSGEGPDIARLAPIIARAGTARRVYAAGGVRGAADLRALRDAGAAGALVATALHGGAITASDLATLAAS